MPMTCRQNALEGGGDNMKKIEIINVLQQLREDVIDEIRTLENETETLAKNIAMNSDLIKIKNNLIKVKYEQFMAIDQTIKQFNLLEIGAI